MRRDHAAFWPRRSCRFEFDFSIVGWSAPLGHATRALCTLLKKSLVRQRAFGARRRWRAAWGTDHKKRWSVLLTDRTRALWTVLKKSLLWQRAFGARRRWRAAWGTDHKKRWS